jgi:hypothetical protein
MKKAKDMKKTLLKFSSAIYLIAFRKFSKAKHWEINLNELTVICDCSEKEAISACKDFRAVIINADEEVELVGKISEFSVVPQVLQRLTS